MCRLMVLLVIVVSAIAFATPLQAGVLSGGTPDSAYASLKLWLNAQSSVYSDAGVTVATGGGTVQQWNNLAISGGVFGDASQATGTKQPILQTAGGDTINSLPTIKFDGSDDFLQGSLPSIGADKTFFMVWKDTGTTDTCCAGGIVTSNFNGLQSVNVGGANVRASADGNGVSVNGSTNITNTPVVGSAVYSGSGAGATTSLYVNGTANGVGSGATFGGAATTGGFFQVGTRLDQLGRYMNGDIAEVLVYDGVLSADDRLALGSYLGAKYGIGYAQPNITTGSAPNPQYENLRAWFVGDQGANNVTNGAAATNGQTVTQWVNQAMLTGAAANAAQTTEAQKPTFANGLGDTINGHAVVRFDGQGQGQGDILNGTLSVTKDKTIFMVMKDTGTPTTCCSGAFHLDGGDNALGTTNVGGTERLNLDFSGSGNVGSTNILNQSIIATLTFDSSNVDGDPFAVMYLNGLVETSENTDIGAIASLFEIGGRNNGDGLGRFFKGDIAEILVFNGKLSTYQMNAIGYYLQQKYGIEGAFTPVPEAGSLLMFSLGTVGLMVVRRRRRI